MCVVCMHATLCTFHELTTYKTKIQSSASGMLRKEESFPKLPEETLHLPCTHQAKLAISAFVPSYLIITVCLVMMWFCFSD